MIILPIDRFNSTYLQFKSSCADLTSLSESSSEYKTQLTALRALYVSLQAAHDEVKGCGSKEERELLLEQMNGCTNELNKIEQCFYASFPHLVPEAKRKAVDDGRSDDGAPATRNLGGAQAQSVPGNHAKQRCNDDAEANAQQADASSANMAGAKPPETEAYWEWRGLKGDWKQYPDPPSAQIEMAWQAFKKNPDRRKASLQSKTGSYIVDFLSMDQINTETLYHRQIRRVCSKDGGCEEFPDRGEKLDDGVAPAPFCTRRVFGQSALNSEEMKDDDDYDVSPFLGSQAFSCASGILRCSDERPLPLPWWKKKSDQPESKAISLRSHTGKLLANLFHRRLFQLPRADDYKILGVEFVQNPQLCREHRFRAKQMNNLPHPDGFDPCNSGVFFHGCSLQDQEGILRQGFDVRLAGRNGSVYGKGIYFAVHSSYAHDYVRRSGMSTTRTMLVCSVHAGRFAQGYSSLVRPPPLDGSDLNGRLFDSVIDNPSNPTIYAIFRKSQAYPAYVITYSVPPESADEASASAATTATPVAPVPQVVASGAQPAHGQSSDAPEASPSANQASAAAVQASAPASAPALERKGRAREPIPADASLEDCRCGGLVKGRVGVIQCDACLTVQHASCVARHVIDAICLTRQDNYLCQPCNWEIRGSGELGGEKPDMGPGRVEPVLVVNEEGRYEAKSPVYQPLYDQFISELDKSVSSRGEADALFTRIHPEIAGLHKRCLDAKIAMRMQRKLDLCDGKGFIEFSSPHPRHPAGQLSLVIHIPTSYPFGDEQITWREAVSGPASIAMQRTIHDALEKKRADFPKPLLITSLVHAWYEIIRSIIQQVLKKALPGLGALRAQGGPI